MNDNFPIVDGLALSQELRVLLRPDEPIADKEGRIRRLPRFFYRIDSWAQARATKLTAHFTLSELMSVDCREADSLFHGFPHYVPCAISVLARYLEEFRTRADAPVMVAVNGGYRSPSHALSTAASPHLWGSAANIFRVGDQWLDSQKSVEKYGRIAESIGQEFYAKPFGSGPGETDDHLHLDLGYLQVEPRILGETN